MIQFLFYFTLAHEKTCIECRWAVYSMQSYILDTWQTLITTIVLIGCFLTTLFCHQMKCRLRVCDSECFLIHCLRNIATCWVLTLFLFCFFFFFFFIQSSKYFSSYRMQSMQVRHRGTSSGTIYIYMICLYVPQW